MNATKIALILIYSKQDHCERCTRMHKTHRHDIYVIEVTRNPGFLMSPFKSTIIDW